MFLSPILKKKNWNKIRNNFKEAKKNLFIVFDIKIVKIPVC